MNYVALDEALEYLNFSSMNTNFVLESIISDTDGIADIINESGEGLGSKIKAGIRKVIDAIKRFFSMVWEKFLDMISKIKRRLQDRKLEKIKYLVKVNLKDPDSEFAKFYKEDEEFSINPNIFNTVKQYLDNPTDKLITDTDKEAEEKLYEAIADAEREVTAEEFIDYYSRNLLAVDRLIPKVEKLIIELKEDKEFYEKLLKCSGDETSDKYQATKEKINRTNTNLRFASVAVKVTMQAVKDMDLEYNKMIKKFSQFFKKSDVKIYVDNEVDTRKSDWLDYLL